MSEKVVVGCGNYLRGDDGVGKLVVERLRREGVPPGTRLLTCQYPDLGLLDLIRGAEKAVIIDAMSCGRRPGTVLLLEEEDLSPAFGVGGLHGLGLAEALALGRILEPEGMPASLALVGIEVSQIRIGAGPAPSVLEAVGEAAGLVRRLLGEGGSGA